MDDPLTLGLAGGALLIMAGLWFLIKRGQGQDKKGRGPATDQTSLLPPGLTLTQQPLLSETEAAFYNLLRMAVQDRFLVFAQVPVWCLVDIHAQDRQARAAFLNQVAFKRVDFALVHPGTRSVVKVVELREASPSSPQRQARDRLLDAVCGQAGIEVIRLDGQAAYTMPVLAAHVGLAPED